MNMIQTFAQQAIQEHQENAAQEISEILGFYILDNTRLNAIYRAARAVTFRADKFTLAQLARVIQEAEREYHP